MKAIDYIPKDIVETLSDKTLDRLEAAMWSFRNLQIKLEKYDPEKVNQAYTAIALEFNVDTALLRSHSRKTLLVICRKLIGEYLRVDMGMSLREVSELVGIRDHSTVCHYAKTWFNQHDYQYHEHRKRFRDRLAEVKELAEQENQAA